MDDQPAEWKAGVDCVKEAKEWAEAIQQSRDNYQRVAESASHASAEQSFQAEQDMEEAEEQMNRILTTHNEKILAMRENWQKI